MISGHYFKRIRNRRRVGTAKVQSKHEALLALLSCYVIERFARWSEADVVAVLLGRAGWEDAEDPPPSPRHPACIEHAGSDYCRESWLLHLAELRRRPETHWHKCDHGRLCAFVPIVYHNRCLAVVKLACPASMARGDFEGQVDLLDVLAHHFVLSQSGFLDRLLQDEETAADIGPLPSRRTKKHAVRRPSHPQVVKAVQYIKKNLSDPKLTVGRVARELEIHPHYLSHLFADQIGQRMSQFIADQRVEQAKTLLATTDWQIKRIAHETGHANPNWFCYIFRTLTGLTPGGYRAQSRGHGRAAASR